MPLKGPWTDRDITVSRALGRRYDFSKWNIRGGEVFSASAVKEYGDAGLASIETAVRLVGGPQDAFGQTAGGESLSAVGKTVSDRERVVTQSFGCEHAPGYQR